MSQLPIDYAERVYAGVLGKIIGVYLGRPIEGMLRADIEKEFGAIEGYVHERRNMPLVVTDDDISGTFTFLRALDEFPDAKKNLKSYQIGDTWLNSIIENKTILWWGGMGMSTEHTAFLRLKRGIQAPMSGSIALNSKVVAEQIGAQIFIDGWGMVCPNDPAQAAYFAEQAGKVSHDGEAIYAAQVVAAMDAAAFSESDPLKLLDIGVSFIPKDSIICRLIQELLEWKAIQPDWRTTMIDLLEVKYGYDKYGGNCHVVPNHALIILALLYGQDFDEALKIVNSCGWDTDCNSGNIGCLFGIKDGLGAISERWRKPVADRILLPTADGGSCITDAVRETDRIVDMARFLSGQPKTPPKDGARFHFSLPGSIQGWEADHHDADFKNSASLENRDGKLAICFENLSSLQFARVSTAVFASLKEMQTSGYGMYASPTLYPGQTVTFAIQAQPENFNSVTVRPYIVRFKKHDRTSVKLGDPITLEPGQSAQPEWKIPDLGGYPIQSLGLEICGLHSGEGAILVDSVSWSGSPRMVIGNSHMAGLAGFKQWVGACDHLSSWGKTEEDQAYVVIQNQGRGMAICGTEEWQDYRVSANLTCHLAKQFGLAARVQGLKRYYALLLTHPNQVRLVKMLNHETVLDEAKLNWRWNDDPHAVALEVKGDKLTAFVDGRELFSVVDSDLRGGACALVVEEGRMAVSPVAVMAI